ncbi:hel-2 [Spodoptera litura granulovirus]|uniref:Hel-2 n=1 Tax=Spodoptera litura granulovirus TaxID=359919 RepID=A5IZX0_9BBAC|nr:hel-2 [Spodoptera litura granulovirus]ABQ52061.1 hel-2 [Spodoptera litura granulovirus]
MKRSSLSASEEDGVCANKLCKKESAPTTLNKQQQQLFDYVTLTKEFGPIFVSGSAGTGKSALLRALQSHWKNKTIWVTTYTNLAARNVNGTTLHKQFKFNFKGEMNTNACVGVPNYFIIDEISMVSSKMLQQIHECLQNNTQVDLPFGGVNTIVFGDLYQLPPISTAKDKSLPPYHADVWKEFKLFELTENMRQNEKDFIDALNMLRIGDSRCQKFFDDKVLQKSPSVEEKLNTTSLVSTHNEANAINEQCYKRICIDKEEHTVELSVEKTNRGRDMIVFNQNQIDMIFKDKMKYCVGTRIMVTHNVAGVFCNGDVGEIVGIEERGVLIKREYDDRVLVLSMIELAFDDDNWRTVTLITGLPMCYAWAITIHKAQGMTVKSVIVHPECVFAKGQAYVALSRVTHFEGLKLVSPLPKKCIKKMKDVDKIYTSQPRLIL